MSRIKYIPAILILSLLIFACSENSTEPENDNFTLSFTSGNSLLKSNLEDLQIESIKILVRDLKLKIASDDSCNVKTGSFVVNLNPDGELTEVAVAEIPEDTYERVKFEIHKLEDSAEPPDPEFKDTNDRYSLIVKGNYKESPFIYKSTKSAKQIIKLDTPISVDDSGLLNVTIIVNPYSWFEEDGEALDPTDPANENDIDKQIKNSFKQAFKDNNRDGQPD